jgi:hypothetical protein
MVMTVGRHEDPELRPLGSQAATISPPPDVRTRSLPDNSRPSPIGLIFPLRC